MKFKFKRLFFLFFVFVFLFLGCSQKAEFKSFENCYFGDNKENVIQQFKSNGWNVFKTDNVSNFVFKKENASFENLKLNEFWVSFENDEFCFLEIYFEKAEKKEVEKCLKDFLKKYKFKKINEIELEKSKLKKYESESLNFIVRIFVDENDENLKSLNIEFSKKTDSTL